MAPLIAKQDPNVWLIQLPIADGIAYRGSGWQTAFSPMQVIMQGDHYKSCGICSGGTITIRDIHPYSSHGDERKKEDRLTRC